MKHLLILFGFLGISVLSFQKVHAQSEEPVSFKTKTHSFGKIPQHKPVSFVFSFTNNGTRPAVIEFADAECGCTKPEYDKSPILKGKTSTIKVTYNAETAGRFSKNVNIKFVGQQLPVVLTVDGEVIPAKGKG
ncbi:MAG TPA: DUF1573 domain-containing protein [Sediminibacterium sp.]|nr:DUF1573 domain-containing protein [Sediminibacterium sp.]